MSKKVTEKISQEKLSPIVYQIFDITRRESVFITLIAILLFVAGSVSPHPQIAMWFGFAMAGYSAIANDSIQTIGTFISSNIHKRWYYLWLFMGGIFLITVTYSWIIYDGDVSYQRLQAKGFAEAPDSFSFLQLSAPVILLILTRMRMPVSTSILLLSAFSSQGTAIVDVLKKSLSGYFLAFIAAIIVWYIIAHFVKHYFKGKPHPSWRYFQWITSGFLWSAWIMQDAANIAIFLPRSLNIYQFIGFAAYIFFGLGLLFYLKGDKIQGIVNEKSGVTDVRAATIVDFVYATILFYFKEVSVIPMSTTWVFIGLLGGRELAISFSKKRALKRKRSIRKSLRMISKDALYAAIGLIVSLLLAFAINADLREAIIK
ncbi:MAG: hypothetical protein ACNS62_11440 [Candidatus Cyclobacteriaceae bacterium M3_2C_046]